MKLPDQITVLALNDNQSISVGFFSRTFGRHLEVLTVGDRDFDGRGRPNEHTVAMADAVIARYNAHQKLVEALTQVRSFMSSGTPSSDESELLEVIEDALASAKD